jgi:hypothetical protein
MAGSTGPNIATDGLFAYFDTLSQIQQPIRNLLTFTDNLNNGSQWTLNNSIITQTASLAPDGTNTAYRWSSLVSHPTLVRLTLNNFSNIQSISGSTATLSIHVKAENNINIIETGIYNVGQTLGTEPAFNVLNNFQPTGGMGSVSIIGINRITEALPNDWYRIQFTGNISSSISRFQNFFDILGSSMVSGSSILIWGPQFEYGSRATPYQNNPASNGANKIWRPIANINTNTSASLTRSTIYQPEFGGMYTFTEASSRLSISNCDFASTSGSSFSIGVWFKRNNLPPQPFSTIYLLGNGGITDARIWMVLDDNNNGSLAINYFTVTGMDSYITLNSNLNTLDWNYAVQVIDKTTLTMRGYLNGRLIGTSNITNSSGSFTSSTTLNFNSGGTSSQISVSNLQIHNRALTNNEVLQNYNSMKSRYGL